MLVMGNVMHLSEQIDLIFEIRVVQLVEPTLDPRNVGVNAAGGVGDEVSNATIDGAHAARAAESNGDSVGGVPQLEPGATCLVDGKGGVEGDGWSIAKAHEDRQLINVPIERGICKSELMLSTFHLHIHACLDCSFLLS